MRPILLAGIAMIYRHQNLYTVDKRAKVIVSRLGEHCYLGRIFLGLNFGAAFFMMFVSGIVDNLMGERKFLVPKMNLAAVVIVHT